MKIKKKLKKREKNCLAALKYEGNKLQPDIDVCHEVKDNKGISKEI